LRFVYRERFWSRSHGNFLHDDFFSGEFQSKPDADGGEEQGNESTVDLQGVFDDEEAKLDQSEQDD
jgi:hypothetical protein